MPLDYREFLTAPKREKDDSKELANLDFSTTAHENLLQIHNRHGALGISQIGTIGHGNTQTSKDSDVTDFDSSWPLRRSIDHDVS